MDLKRKEGREEILVVRSERRVDVCSLTQRAAETLTVVSL